MPKKYRIFLYFVCIFPQKRLQDPKNLKSLFIILRCEVLHTTVLNCCAHEKTGAALFRKKRGSRMQTLGSAFYLPKLVSRLFSETKDW